MRESWWRVLGALAILAVVCAQGYMLHSGNNPLETMDTATQGWALNNRNAFLTWGAKLIDVLTLPVVVIIVALLAGVFFIGLDRGLKRGLTIIATVLGALAFCFVLRASVERPRPALADQLARIPGAHSYPSAHTTGSTALMVILAWVATAYSLKLWMRLALDTAAIATGFVAGSRVYIGAGWTSDQLAGVLIALALGLLVSAIIDLAWPWLGTHTPYGVARWFNDDSGRRRPKMDLADGPS